MTPPFDPPTAPFHPPEQPKVSKPKKWPWIVGIVAAFVFGFGIGVAGTDQAATQAQPRDYGSPEIVDPEVVDPVAEPEPAEEPPPLPKPEDFSVELKTLSKECFGSAGCLITFTIVPNYTGATPPEEELTVTYEVTGGKDPLINSFTVQGDTATYQEQQSIQTSSSSAELTAEVTEVF